MTTKFDPNAAASEDSGVYGLPFSPDEARVVLVPVPWDATTSYRDGTRNGPAAILDASKQVDLYDLEWGRVYEPGIAMLDVDPAIGAMQVEARRRAEPIIDIGGAIGDSRELAADLARVNGLGAELNSLVERTVDAWLAKGKLVGVVGGDHSVPFGAIAAHAKRHPGLGVLHIDALADLRDAYEGFAWSHASIMHNVITRIPAVARLVQVGIRDFGEAEYELIRANESRITTFFDADLSRERMEGTTWAEQCKRICAQLPPEVYVSFDIDGLDPAYCPHTGTPVPGGISFHQMCYLLRALVDANKRVVGFDLNEVAPGPEGDEWDANVGARMLYKMIGAAIASTRNR